MEICSNPNSITKSNSDSSLAHKKPDSPIEPTSPTQENSSLDSLTADTCTSVPLKQSQKVTFKIRLPAEGYGESVIDSLSFYWRSFVSILDDLLVWIVLSPAIIVPLLIIGNQLVSKLPVTCPNGVQSGALTMICGFDTWNPGFMEFVSSADIFLTAQQKHLYLTSYQNYSIQSGIYAQTIVRASVKGRAPVFKTFPRLIWPITNASISTYERSVMMGDPQCVSPPLKHFYPGPISSISKGFQFTILAIIAKSSEDGVNFRHAIELFRLNGKGDDAQIFWLGCVPVPPTDFKFSALQILKTYKTHQLHFVTTSVMDMEAPGSGDLLPSQSFAASVHDLLNKVVPSSMLSPPKNLILRGENMLSAGHHLQNYISVMKQWLLDFSEFTGEPTGLIREFVPSSTSNSTWIPTRYFKSNVPNSVVYQQGSIFVSERDSRRVCRMEYQDFEQRKCILISEDRGDTIQNMVYWRSKKSLVVLLMKNHLKFETCIASGKKQCTNSWSLSLINVKTLEVSRLYDDDGYFYGGATSMAVIEDSVIIGSRLNDRIVVFS